MDQDISYHQYSSGRSQLRRTEVHVHVFIVFTDTAIDVRVNIFRLYCSQHSRTHRSTRRRSPVPLTLWAARRPAAVAPLPRIPLPRSNLLPLRPTAAPPTSPACSRRRSVRRRESRIMTNEPSDGPSEFEFISPGEISLKKIKCYPPSSP